MSIERVLIVEDEPLIAMMLEDFLEMLGKQLAGTCDTVQSALATIADERPDAAILDINLSGGEKSWAVADALAAAGIPFVLSSGGDEVTDGHADRPRLTKPYTMDGVEKALAALDT
ncbi:response regulator [Sphingomonas sp.]|jgi:DNA-binding response OmpR family regulator|uniref:response regulator n=1 Tax=Sphingomonas sp. TaxID=28214 RepID=UPI002E315D78|nr:response regulator [Sphingomonas sp.]HEX4693539.1 response regulator [Sphingomonas sp.]